MLEVFLDYLTIRVECRIEKLIYKELLFEQLQLNLFRGGKLTFHLLQAFVGKLSKTLLEILKRVNTLFKSDSSLVKMIEKRLHSLDSLPLRVCNLARALHKVVEVSHGDIVQDKAVVFARRVL